MLKDQNKILQKKKKNVVVIFTGMEMIEINISLVRSVWIC